MMTNSKGTLRCSWLFACRMVATGVVITLAGCGGSSGGSGSGGGGGTTLPGALASGGAASIYVIQGTESGTGSTVLEFAADASGSISPAGTLIPPTTTYVLSVATDSSGQIYVGGLGTTNGEILVYAAGATGAATPVRTIAIDGSETLVIPSSMTVDSAGVIYATGPSGNVAVIAAGASGTTTPTRLLTSGTLTGPVGIAVDAAGEIFVANETLAGPGDNYIEGSILVFGAGANGGTDPLRVISGPTPTATSSNTFYGLAVDAAGEITTVFDTDTFDSSGDVTASTAEVEEFAAGATGSPTPTKTISGAATMLKTGGGLRVDGVGNLYVVNAGGTTTVPTFSVLGFGPNATGDVAPGLDISSSSWSLAGSEIAVH